MVWISCKTTDLSSIFFLLFLIAWDVAKGSGVDGGGGSSANLLLSKNLGHISLTLFVIACINLRGEYTEMKKKIHVHHVDEYILKKLLNLCLGGGSHIPLAELCMSTEALLWLILLNKIATPGDKFWNIRIFTN